MRSQGTWKARRGGRAELGLGSVEGVPRFATSSHRSKSIVNAALGQKGDESVGPRTDLHHLRRFPPREPVAEPSGLPEDGRRGSKQVSERLRPRIAFLRQQTKLHLRETHLSAVAGGLCEFPVKVLLG
jgi:hypothetical protein